MNQFSEIYFSFIRPLFVFSDVLLLLSVVFFGVAAFLHFQKKSYKKYIMLGIVSVAVWFVFLLLRVLFGGLDETGMGGNYY